MQTTAAAAAPRLTARGVPTEITAHPQRRIRVFVDTDYTAHARALWAHTSAVCVFDLETTDKMDALHPDGPHKGQPIGRVMQLAARRYVRAGSGWRLAGELNVLINDPDIRDCCLAPQAAAVHGISVADLRGPGPNAYLKGIKRLAPKEAWKAFLDLSKGAFLAGQNIIGFDIPFANREMARHGLSSALEVSQAIDTLLVARAIYDLPVGRNQPGYRLRSLADRLGVATDPKLDHNALGDIDTCWKVWMAMQEDLERFATKFLGRKPEQYRGELGKVGNGGWRS
jgi:DNA polymerase III epsilon subunit-like protein